MRDDLPHAMRETARRLEPDVVRLAAGGVSRGVRMRRIERIVQVVGSVVAVAVVFAGVAWFGPRQAVGTKGGGEDGGGGGGANQSAAAGTGTTSATESPSPSNAATTASTPSSAEVPMITGNELISALKSSLGGTGVTIREVVARGSDYAWTAKPVPASAISVSAQLTVAKQVGSIAIVVYGAQDEQNVPKLGKRLPQNGGTVVYVSQGSGSSDGRQINRTDLTVTLVRADGSSLSVLETDAPNEKSAAAYGARLLLSPDQIIAMMDSSTWDAAAAAADALPVFQDQPESGASDVVGFALMPSSANFP